MRTMIALLLAAIVSPVLAAPPSADNAAPETRTCLDNRSMRAKDLSAEHGYFVRTPQGWWRNTGPACSAYAPNRALLTQSTLDRQCRGDVVVVFDTLSRIEFGSCILGSWVRVDAPPKD